MCYAIALRYTQKGELKSRIIEHMLSCNSNEAETVSHISKVLDALQPDVFRSTKALVAGGILEKTEISSNKKELRLTDKGAAIAVLAGIESEKLEEYYSNTKPKDYKSESDRERHKLFEVIRLQTEDTTKQKIILKRALEYMLEHGWYNEENRVLNPQEKLNLFLSLSPLVQTKTLDLKEYIELSSRFGLPNDLLGMIPLIGLRDNISLLNKFGQYLDMSRVIASTGGWDYKSLVMDVTILLDEIRKAAEAKVEYMTDKFYLKNMGLVNSFTTEEARSHLRDEIDFTIEAFENILNIKKLLEKVKLPDNAANIKEKGIVTERKAT